MAPRSRSKKAPAAATHVRSEVYNPVSIVPCPPGWKAIFEVCDESERIVDVVEETVVMWAVMEHRTECRIEGEDEPHWVGRRPNFVAGLIISEFSEGGLEPALTREGLIGYKAPKESLDDFAVRMNIDLAAMQSGDEPRPLTLH